MRTRVGDVALALLLAACRSVHVPAREQDEPCGSCESRSADQSADVQLSQTLCALNLKPLREDSSAEESIRFTDRSPIRLRRNTPNQAEWERALGTQLQAVIVRKNGGHCEAERVVRWEGKPGCEIGHTRVELSNAECNELLACLRAAIPPGQGVSECHQGMLGTDGDVYTVELSDAQRHRTCIWSEPPSCVSTTMGHAWTW
jgi:hypothetical protein